MDYGQLKNYIFVVPIVMFIVNLAIVINHNFRILRALFCLLTLFAAALDLSFGAINHPWHMWIWISFIFVFLPNPESMSERAFKLSTVSTIVYVQAMLLLFYTMAGAGKFKAGIAALIAGTSGNFSLTGFASLLADRMLQGHGSTILGWVFVDWPYLGFLPFTAIIILQAISVFVAFIPRLHRIWGLMLILFHFGTALLMDIYFPTHVAWMAIFFVFSPFYTGYGYRLREPAGSATGALRL